MLQRVPHVRVGVGCFRLSVAFRLHAALVVVLPFGAAEVANADSATPVRLAPTITVSEAMFPTVLEPSAGRLSRSGSDVTVAQAADGSSGAAGLSAVQATAAQPSPPDYGRFDLYRLRGVNIPLPGPQDTVDQDLLGGRDALARLGIGYFGYSNTFFEDNLLRHALPTGNARSNQLYNGQLPTYISSNVFDVTYDLTQYGVPDGQVVAGLNFFATNWKPSGPQAFSLTQLSYFQTLFHKKVEIEAGYLPNNLYYLDTYVGGSLSGGVFGPNGTAPVEAGLNNGTVSTPGVNVKIYLPSNFYTKAGVQRAISPDGTVTEHGENTSATRFALPNTGALYIDETGYQVAATPSVMQTWVRAAAVYTSSNYREINNSVGQTSVRGSGEYGVFLLADRQLLKISRDPRASRLGLYAGFSYFYTPPGFNRFSQIYEARIYGFGLIPGRPRDLLSAVYDNSLFSGYLVHAADSARQRTHDSSNSFTLSYSAHVHHGVYINVGLTYVDHPTAVTYTSRTGSDLNSIIGVVLFL